MPPELDASAEPGRPSLPEWPGDPRIEPQETRNLFLLAFHQIVFRIGWVFKTESVIMPAFLDLVAGAGWVRGCLPVLNRLGQSVPPVFAAEILKSMRCKKRALVGFTVLMSLPFALLSAVWFSVGRELEASGQKVPWLAGLFLVLYCGFFVLYGLYLVSFGTVQGKLIRPTRRGHLLLVSTFWGAIPATLVAVSLMPDWLERKAPAWELVFAFVAICFFLSGLLAQLLYEPGDEGPPAATRHGGNLRDMMGTLRRDDNLRSLVAVVMLFASVLIIFPHYQALARERLGLSGVHLVVWVVTQNVAVAVYSLFVGPLADRRGNRLTMRLLIFASAIPPAFALALPYLPHGTGRHLFWLVYIPLGVTPLVLRTVFNYALEICPAELHPRYLSTVSLGLAVPFVFSPLVGWLVDVADFEIVFSGAVLLICLSGWLTFRLEEPRYGLAEGGKQSGGLPGSHTDGASEG